MDKNRIHIDDLVRNRLSGAEEKEPAGAWSSMRDLLDKEMPVETAAFNWRRMLSYATAVILATSVSVGGYNYYHQAMVAPVSQSTIANSSNQTRAASSFSAPDVADLAAVAANSTHRTPSSTNNHSVSTTATTNRTQSATSRNHSTVPTAQTTAASSNVAGTQSIHVSPDNSDASSQPLSTAAIVASSNSDLSKPSEKINASRELAAGKNVDRNTLPAALKPAKGKPVANKHSVTPSGPLAQSNGSTQNDLPTGSNMLDGQKHELVTASSYTVGATEHKQTFVLTKDTIKQIEIAYRRTAENNYHNPRYVRDTLSVTKVVVEKRKPVEASATQQHTNVMAVNRPSQPAPVKPVAVASSSVTPVPQSAAISSAEAIAAQDNIKLVSLSQFRIASKFNKLWNVERYKMMVQNVKADLSRVQFYAGMTGGLNASLFTATAMAGFQAGLTGLLKFNEQWSLAGELKFYQRFNTGNAIKDNYVKKEDWMPGNYTTVNGVAYREWTWREDTVAHSFNFTTVQTLEIPLLLRYNVGRVFAEAGINMMYAFTVNAEEIDRPNGNSTYRSRQMPATFTPESIGGNKPTISNSDFGSRFGLGYALGLGYQITPALQANCRLVHSVWDNASSVGAGKVSRNLYQTPSIQFSVGYRFKQGKGK